MYFCKTIYSWFSFIFILYLLINKCFTIFISTVYLSRLHSLFINHNDEITNLFLICVNRFVIWSFWSLSYCFIRFAFIFLFFDFYIWTFSLYFVLIYHFLTHSLRFDMSILLTYTTVLLYWWLIFIKGQVSLVLNITYLIKVRHFKYLRNSVSCTW